MIVKDEAHVISETLDSIAGYIDYWVICDTGSTDNTEQVVRTYFKQHKIKGEYLKHKWLNFGHNRTLALEAAYGKSKYVWCIDADDVIRGSIDLTPLSLPTLLPVTKTKTKTKVLSTKGSSSTNTMLSNKSLPQYDCFALRYKIGNMVYYRSQIFRNDIKWCYRAVLHEFPCLGGNVPVNDKMLFNKHTLGNNNYYVESRRLGSRNKDSNKYQKDAQLIVDTINTILSSQQSNNSNHDVDLLAHYYFYAGQSFFDYKDYTNSIIYYSKCIEVSVNNNNISNREGVYISYLSIGMAKEELKYYPQKDIVDAYQKGYEIMPNRAETLFRLGVYYKQCGNLDMAFVVLCLASQITFPHDCILFVQVDIYQYRAKFELAMVCNLLGKYSISHTLCQDLLTHIIPTITCHQTVNLLTNNINMLIKSNNNKRPLLVQYDFEDYNFVPQKDIDGYTIFNINEINNNNLKQIIPLDLKKVSDSMDDCLSFNTNGEFKNVICTYNSLTNLLSTTTTTVNNNNNNIVDSKTTNVGNYVPGLYVKKQWKQNKPNLCFYVDNIKLVNVDCQPLLMVCEHLKLHYNVFIVDNNYNDKLIKHHGIYMSNSKHLLTFNLNVNTLILFNTNVTNHCNVGQKITLLWQYNDQQNVVNVVKSVNSVGDVNVVGDIIWCVDTNTPNPHWQTQCEQWLSSLPLQ